MCVCPQYLSSITTGSIANYSLNLLSNLTLNMHVEPIDLQIEFINLNVHFVSQRLFHCNRYCVFIQQINHSP